MNLIPLFNFLTHATLGNKLVSHAIYNKLPNIVKHEFIHVTENNYPTINMIIDRS